MCLYVSEPELHIDFNSSRYNEVLPALIAGPRLDLPEGENSNNSGYLLELFLQEP